MSRDTVYRTLRLLQQKDLVSTVGTLHERVRFDPNTDRHHHFICTRCGAVRDFYSDELNAYEPPEEVRRWGRIESMQAELRGTCSECLRGEETASA
jgi:Fur family peroxide stress response transcriptional regulator